MIIGISTICVIAGGIGIFIITGFITLSKRINPDQKRIIIPIFIISSIIAIVFMIFLIVFILSVFIVGVD